MRPTSAPGVGGGDTEPSLLTPSLAKAERYMPSAHSLT